MDVFFQQVKVMFDGLWPMVLPIIGVFMAVRLLRKILNQMKAAFDAGQVEIALSKMVDERLLDIERELELASPPKRIHDSLSMPDGSETTVTYVDGEFIFKHGESRKEYQ